MIYSPHFQSHEVPLDTRSAIQSWIKYGTIPRRFIWGVICNDLRVTVAASTSDDLHHLVATLTYLYITAPPSCWGSTAKAEAWQEGMPA